MSGFVRFIVTFLIAAPVVLTGGAGGVSNVPWHPAPGLTWQWQLDDPEIEPIRKVDVYDIDGFGATKEMVGQLHALGIRAICYIDAGTWEDWRPDAGDYPAEIIGKSWPEWEGERFVDIRRLDLLGPILEKRFDLCAVKGFDAIEPDMIDTYEADTGFDISRNDQLAFNRWIADQAHALGLAIGQKNVPELTPELVDAFDFAITEDCLADSWCEQMQPYTDAGKAVFAAEYTDREMTLAKICPRLKALGFSGILKHRDLDAWLESCGRG